MVTGNLEFFGWERLRAGEEGPVFGPLTTRKDIEGLERVQTLEQAAQGGGGVTFPGDVQKPCRRGTLRYGLVGAVLLGGWLDLMIIEVFSNL